MVPVVAVRENTGPVVPTPQYRKAGYRDLGRFLMALGLTATQKSLLSVRFTDSKGNPANVEGPPAWSCDNTDVLALAPSADGLSCECAAVGPIGTGLVTMTADADLGAGVTPLVGTLEVNVTAGQATVVEIATGPVTEQ